MSYLLGSGAWVLWYVFLWAAVAPFAALLVAFARAQPGEVSNGVDVAFALCNVGLFALLAATLVSAVLWAAAGHAPGAGKYVRALALWLTGWLVGGWFVYMSLFQAASHTEPHGARWRALLVVLAAVLLAHAANLHAAWRFRRA